MSRRLSILLPLVALLCAVSASGAQATRSGAAWQRFHSQAGFTISAPATWVDFTSLTPKVLATVKSNPSLASYVDYVRTTRALKLLLVDVSPTSLRSGAASNFNLVQVPVSGVDLQLTRDATIAQLRGLHLLVGTPHSSFVKLPAGQALKLSYTARYRGHLVAQTQFYVPHAGNMNVLTYTTAPTFVSRYASVFKRSARSLRFSG